MTHPSDNSSKGAPLHERFPLEIFHAIIHLCIGSTTPIRNLVTLQLVCRRWHDIIADASFLWGTINADEGLRAMHKALQMAKDALLDLVFIDTNSKIRQNWFFKLARERIHQWRSLVVESQEWQSALDDLRSQKPPKLDKLHVATTCYPLKKVEEIVLFGGDPALGLKDVRLAEVPISRVSLHLSGLKSLRLEGIPSVSAAEVITLITESPGLEILHLHSLEGAVLPTDATHGHPNFASSSPIELASLIELKLFLLPLSFLSHLLSTLAFPQLRSLRVGCDLRLLSENPALRLGETVGLDRLNPSINSIARGAHMYKVTLSSLGYYEICIGGLDIGIYHSGGLSLDHFLDTFIWLSGHLKQPLHDLPLHLNLQNCDPEPSHLEWFTRCANVTTLTLSSNPFLGRLENFIQILSQPTSLPPSPPTWLLPQTEVLHTSCVWMGGDLKIVDMIERRQSASRGSFAAGVSGASPKRFREIWLAYSGIKHPWYSPDTEFLSKVGRVAGGADVYWEGKKWLVS